MVIASGGLDLYLPTVLKAVPYDELICTRAEVTGALTGAMVGGNCVRARKAAMVQDWLDRHGRFEDSWGYGNAPHDLPMMALMKNRVVIR